MAEVLVLNQNFEPLNICTMRRAVNMVLTGKAEVVLTNGHYIRTVSGGFEAPSVVRLRYLVKRPLPHTSQTCAIDASFVVGGHYTRNACA